MGGIMTNSEKQVKEKSRAIPNNTNLVLWAKSAGRCQICGKKLYENDKFGIEVNVSQRAHIFAFVGKVLAIRKTHSMSIV